MAAALIDAQEIGIVLGAAITSMLRRWSVLSAAPRSLKVRMALTNFLGTGTVQIVAIFALLRKPSASNAAHPSLLLPSRLLYQVAQAERKVVKQLLTKVVTRTRMMTKKTMTKVAALVAVARQETQGAVASRCVAISREDIAPVVTDVVTPMARLEVREHQNPNLQMILRKIG